LKLDRRTFMKRAVAALGLLALKGVPTTFAEEGSWTSVGRESDFPLDTPLYLKDYLAYVMRHKEGVLALSARCTHRGCTVDWTEGEFVCPCHQARFSRNGAVLNGPATDPLLEIPSRLDEGQVWLGL